jgi:hypothetical protein
MRRSAICIHASLILAAVTWLLHPVAKTRYPANRNFHYPSRVLVGLMICLLN